MKRNVIVVILIIAAAGCGTSSASKKWGLATVPTNPAQVEVLSATTFKCSNVPCKLLGLKDPSDAEIQAEALAFTRKWFDESGGYIMFYNNDNPLQSPNGDAIVWILRYDQHLSCLNEQLAQRGLADLDLQPADYTFTENVKGRGKQLLDWQRCLKDAAKSLAKNDAKSEEEKAKAPQ